MIGMNHLGLCLWVSDVYNSHSDGIFVKKYQHFKDKDVRMNPQQRG